MQAEYSVVEQQRKDIARLVRVLCSLRRFSSEEVRARLQPNPAFQYLSIRFTPGTNASGFAVSKAMLARTVSNNTGVPR
jgi:hypothetical protein